MPEPELGVITLNVEDITVWTIATQNVVYKKSLCDPETIKSIKLHYFSFGHMTRSNLSKQVGLCPIMQSICDNPAFNALRTLINQPQLPQTWALVLYNQAYPDPRELLCDDDFSSMINATEPGMRIDYAKLSNHAQLAQQEPDQRLRNAKTCNDLLGAHHNYTQARACVEGYTLYDTMIDRFYNRTSDIRFERFVAAGLNSNIQQVWPRYEVLKQTNHIKLNSWISRLRESSSTLTQIKASSTTKQFLTNLEIALDSRLEPSLYDSHPPQYSGKPALTLAERKLAIARRNRVTKKARVKANSGLKAFNVENPHQAGERGLHPNSAEAVAAIMRTQNDWIAKQSEVTYCDLYEFRKGLENEGLKPAAIEAALEKAKADLEADDDSDELEIMEGFCNVAHVGQDEAGH